MATRGFLRVLTPLLEAGFWLAISLEGGWGTQGILSRLAAGGVEGLFMAQMSGWEMPCAGQGAHLVRHSADGKIDGRPRRPLLSGRSQQWFFVMFVVGVPPDVLCWRSGAKVRRIQSGTWARIALLN